MENGIVPRDKYMRILRESRDLPFIKVITGMRRCGKSTLMAMMREEISDSGVPENRIFSMNLDDETEHSADSYTNLIDIVKSAVPIKKGTYILLDEIQNVKWWERAVESFYAAGADVYVTGSNLHAFFGHHHPSVRQMSRNQGLSSFFQRIRSVQKAVRYGRSVRSPARSTCAGEGSPP